VNPDIYEVRLHPQAARAFRRLQNPLRDRIATAIDALANDPRPTGTTRLAGRDDYRVRVGDYRIIYAVDDDERLVVVARIAHRRDVYRRELFARRLERVELNGSALSNPQVLLEVPKIAVLRQRPAASGSDSQAGLISPAASGTAEWRSEGTGRGGRVAPGCRDLSGAIVVV
jgi:mRNA interferase RelE/StbE